MVRSAYSDRMNDEPGDFLAGPLVECMAWRADRSSLCSQVVFRKHIGGSFNHAGEAAGDFQYPVTFADMQPIPQSALLFA